IVHKTVTYGRDVIEWIEVCVTYDNCCHREPCTSTWCDECWQCRPYNCTTIYTGGSGSGSWPPNPTSPPPGGGGTGGGPGPGGDPTGGTTPPDCTGVPNCISGTEVINGVLPCGNCGPGPIVIFVPPINDPSNTGQYIFFDPTLNNTRIKCNLQSLMYTNTFFCNLVN